MSIVWLAETLRDGRPSFRIGREGDRMIADWPGLAVFVVARDGTDPTLEPVAGAEPRLLEKLRTSAIPALVRHLRGGVTLHASAVASNGNAVAFVGDSGMGKSTLAYALATSATHSFALLSDDCLFVQDMCALPSDSVTWIDGAARRAVGATIMESKSAARPLRVATQAAPLRRVIVLAFGAELRVTRLVGSAIAGVLGPAMIRFVLDEPEVHAADLERMANIASRVEVFALSRPRGFEHLPATLIEVERFARFEP